MRGGSAPLLAWACLLLVLGAGLAAFSELVPALLFAAGAAPLLALAAWSRAVPPPPARVLPRVSLPVVLVAVGLAAAAFGLTAGLWLGLVGAEVVLFGAVWLAREIVAERRLR